DVEFRLGGSFFGLVEIGVPPTLVPFQFELDMVVGLLGHRAACLWGLDFMVASARGGCDVRLGWRGKPGARCGQASRADLTAQAAAKGMDRRTQGRPSIGVKICAADHKLLETQSMPPTLHGGAAGCEGGILTPMGGPGGLRGLSYIAKRC